LKRAIKTNEPVAKLRKQDRDTNYHHQGRKRGYQHRPYRHEKITK
jgi:hypothetical protein